MTAGPTPRLSARELRARASELRALQAPCELCPRRCAVDRERELGRCRQTLELAVAAVCPHRGEEPPLADGGGAGTVFLAGCNMACRFCQNHQISQRAPRESWRQDVAQLGRAFLELERRGCNNVEWVSPTQHLPALVAALAHARERGLALPVVYNSNGYEREEVIALLDGVVDIWLPDAKYASEESAGELSHTPDYVAVNRRALLAMTRQSGPLVVDGRGVATRGVLVRHLVLPGHVRDSVAVLRWIGEALGPATWVSLMAQYHPAHELATGSAAGPAALRRALSLREHRRAVAALADAGLELGWVQELAACARFLPDFEREQGDPFADAAP
jgi:putative pyruvate formate lyase activating enzyme